MNANKTLILVIVSAIALFGSLFLGSAAAQTDFTTIGAFLGGVVALTTYLVLGKNTWILIPVFAMWQGKIGILPIPFSVNNLVVGFAVFCWVVNILSRREKLRHSLTGLDMMVICMVTVLVLGFARNPVSLRIFGGGGAIGARPYFEMVMGVMAYVMLSSIRIDGRWLKRIPYITIATSVVLAIGGAIAYFMPSIGIYLNHVYSGFALNSREFGGGIEGGLVVTRAGYLTPLAATITAILYSKRAPLMNLSLRHPLRTIALGGAFLLTLVSGFRGAFAAQGMYFLIGSWMWWKGKGLVVTGVLGTLALVGIFAISMVVEVPLGMQRALTFLPGDWNREVVMQAEGSTDFRINMWHQAWNEGGIQNVWFGDGYRIPMGELQYYQELQMRGYVKEADKITYYLITGDLHSGPLSTIKYVGVLGLVVFSLLIMTIAVKIYKLWNLAIQSRSQLMIGFYALPLIYFPIVYMFIFGSFRVDLPRVFVGAGLLVLLTNALRDELAMKRKEDHLE